MSQTWTLGSRVSRRESRTMQDGRYDRRAVRPEENSKGFITVAGHTERRPFFLGVLRTFVTLDPGEVLWDTGAQEGLVGKQQLDKWCKLARGTRSPSRMEPGEARIRKRHWRRHAIGVVYVPVGLAGCNGVIRFTVVEQDVPPLLPVGIMRTLQASMDLNDDGDKVIFRQFGGESSSRTLQSGHTVIRADQFDPDVWQLQEPRNCVRTTMKDAQQITCQSSLTCTRDPDAWTTIHQQETMSGIYGRALEAQRHGTLWTIKPWKRLAHYMLYGRCAAFFDDPHGTIRGHPACTATTGATRDEEQEEQSCESSAGSVGARQSLKERQPGNPVEEGAERLRSPPTAIQKGGNAAMYYGRCEMCGNRWQRIPLTIVARDAETTLNNRTVLASTGKRPVEIERPFCPHGHGSVMMQATPQ